MEPEVCFKSIEEAVLCFYDSSHPSRAFAQKWLNEIQQKPEIWRVIWEEMLTSQKPELQFYGATLLHSKLLNDWEQVPLDEYDTLKSKMLEAILYFKTTSRLVHERMCIAFAVYVVRTTNQWPNAISDIISLFQAHNVPNQPEEVLASIVLEILSAIPEQFQTMILTKNQEIFARSALNAESTTVSILLENTLVSKNMEIMSQALKCLKGWLEFGMPMENIEKLLNILVSIVIIPYSGGHTDAEMLHFQAELSKNTISAVEAISLLFNHSSLDKNPNTVAVLLKNVIVLSNIVKEKDRNGADMDVIGCLCTLFVEIGEAHTKVLLKLLETEDRVITLEWIHTLLEFTNAPGYYVKDETYSTQTLSLWFHIEDEMICCNFDETTANLVKPFYRLLVPILIRKCTYAEDFTSWSKQDQDQFNSYRQDIGDAFSYCYAAIGDELLEAFLNGIRYAIADISTINNRWVEIEAYMHAFQAIALTTVTDNRRLTEKFMTIVHGLPFSQLNIAVSYAALEMFGAYGEWFCEYPVVLNGSLEIILQMVHDKRLTSKATLALKEISRECSKLMLPYAEGILMACEEILSDITLHKNDVIRMVFVVGKIASLLPMDSMMQHIEKVVTPCVRTINELLETMEKPIGTTDMLVHCATVITQIFLACEVKGEKSPVFLLFLNLLPIYQKVCLTFSNPEVANAVSTSLRCGICTLNDTCLDLLPNIINFLVDCYTNNPQPAFLEFAKQVILMFGKKDNAVESIQGLLRELSMISLNLFRNCKDGNLSECWTQLEAFYQMCTHVLKKNYVLLTTTPGVEIGPFFSYASAAMRIQEANAVKAAAVFICHVITGSREEKKPELLKILQAQGAQLVYDIMYAIGKTATRTCLEPITDVLLTLNKKHGDSLGRWLHEVLQPADFPSPRVAPEIKEKFVKTILKERKNRRKVWEVVRELSLTCRGLINNKVYIHATSSSVMT